MVLLFERQSTKKEIMPNYTIMTCKAIFLMGRHVFCQKGTGQSSVNCPYSENRPAPRLTERADLSPVNWTKNQAPSAATQAVCLFVQYCHFAALEKLRLCGPLPRAHGTIYAQLSRVGGVGRPATPGAGQGRFSE